MSRKRLTEEQKTDIQTALAGGESGKDIAARMGISPATVYAQRRKSDAPPATTGNPGESVLRHRLVTFAIKTLLGHDIPDDERHELTEEVREEVLRRVTAGI